MSYQPKQEHLNTFVTALALVATEEIVDMDSINRGNCGTPGCHGWLVFRTLNYIEGVDDEAPYDFGAQAYRLENFLETGKRTPQSELNHDDFASSGALSKFAKAHPEWWGNSHGIDMFYEIEAFLPQRQKRALITELDIYNWWAAVAKRPIPEASL